MLRGIRRVLPRLYRLAVVLAAALLMHQQHQRLRAQRDTALTVKQARSLFPTAARLGPRTPPHNIQTVQDADGRQLGLVFHTSPEADDILGYTGPSNVLVALDPTGRVTGAALLSSEDTADHVATVAKSGPFWRGFHGLTLGSPGRPEIDAVSGATLTSSGIVSAVTRRLGGTTIRDSALFPTEILLVEVQLLLPEARSLTAHPAREGVQQVKDAQGTLIAHALRTSPGQDHLLGYQGPTDTLILLDAKAETVRALRFRKSYDNDEYLDRMLDGEAYLAQFNGWPIGKVAGLDLEEAGIEGVSGATHSSWALVEGVRRRLHAFLADRDRPPPPFPVSPRQFGLFFLTLGGLMMSFTKLRGQAHLRIAWQILLVLYLGLLTGDLLSMALFSGWAQNGVAWLPALGSLVMAGAAFLIPWSTGHQLYCHHLCPHGALQQWMQKIPLPNFAVPPKLHRLLSAVPFVLLAFVLGNVMLGLGVNNAALEAFDAYLFRVAGWSSITIAVVGLLASAVVPLAYCKYGCPTGLLLKFLRSRGANDRLGSRDLLAGGLLLTAGALYLLP
ncbi:MAG: FMN-binding protein [Verrucomicrobia bacterium]|nr:FMN-binding protein [Verrucomicrobiota bacterium]MDA1005260.1 FMN-binding protein [Verrucomicrobiota bacterium]